MKKHLLFAFTLLELIVVLAIIVVMSSLGIPSLRQTLARSEFREGVVMLQTELQRTRLLAMKSGVPYVFHFQNGTGIYEILPKEDYLEHYLKGGARTGFAGSMNDQKENENESFAGSDQFEESDTENPEGEISESAPSTGSAFTGSLAAPQDIKTDQVSGGADAIIQNEGGLDLSADAETGKIKVPSAVKELPGGVRFWGISISEITPSETNGPGGSASEQVNSGSVFSGSLQSPAEGPVLEFDPAQNLIGPDENGGSYNSEGSVTPIWADPILFYPNGRTSHAVIHLKSDGDYSWFSEVALRGLTGVPRINFIESR